MGDHDAVERLFTMAWRAHPENELMGTSYRHLLYADYRTIFRVTGQTVLVVRFIHGSRLFDSSMLDGRD